jgi:hypothetical protein
MKQCDGKVMLCLAVFLLINNSVLALPTPADDTIASSVSNLFGKVRSSVTSGAKKVQNTVTGAASTVSDSVVDGYEFVKNKLTDSKKQTTTTKSPILTTTTTETIIPLVHEEKHDDPLKAEASIVDNTNVTLLATDSLTDPKKAAAKALELDVTPTAMAISTVATPDSVSTTAKSPVRIDNDAIVFVDEDANIVDNKFFNIPEETTTDITDNRHVFDSPVNCVAGKRPVNGNCRKIV